MASVPKPIKGKKLKVAKEPKVKGKRGRPKGAINEDTLLWLATNEISETIYKKILEKIKGTK